MLEISELLGNGRSLVSNTLTTLPRGEGHCRCPKACEFFAGGEKICVVLEITSLKRTSAGGESFKIKEREPRFYSRKSLTRSGLEF